MEATTLYKTQRQTTTLAESGESSRAWQSEIFCTNLRTRKLIVQRNQHILVIKFRFTECRVLSLGLRYTEKVKEIL